MDPESDRNISDHVLRMHKYRAPGEQDGDRKSKFLVFTSFSPPEIPGLSLKVAGTSLSAFSSPPWNVNEEKCNRIFKSLNFVSKIKK